MPAPIVAAAVLAARLAAKAAAKKAAKKVVLGKGSGKKVVSTGKSKIDSLKTDPSKKYQEPVKGSGKPAYKNVIKEERVNTKKSAVESKALVKNILGKKFNAQEKRAVGNKAPNLAKSIDREEKIRKGVRTQSPSTSKVPTKKPKLSK